MDDLGNGWSKVTVLEKDKNDFYNRYYYKRVKAKRIEIDTPKARALASYTLIEKDLRNILSWIQEISNLMKADEKLKANPALRTVAHDQSRYEMTKALFVASLSFYGKCFTSCEGRRIKLEKKNIAKEFLDVHESIMEMRHNFAAHSGATQVEKVKVILALDSKKRKNATPYFSRELGQPASFSLTDISEIKGLVGHLQKFVNEKIKTLNHKILHEDIISKGAEYWYKRI